MKKIFKACIAVFAAFAVILLTVSCSGGNSAGEITEIAEDGTLTVVMKDGTVYTYKPVERSEEKMTEEINADASRVSVTELGAKCDGTADCAEAFQKAISRVSEKGGAVYVPAGTYLLTKSLVIEKDNVMILGDASATRIVCAVNGSGDTSAFIKLVDGVSGVRIADLCIEYGEGASCAYGIHAGVCDNVSFSGIAVKGFAKAGLFIGGTAEKPDTRISVSECSFSSAGRAGIELGYTDGIGISFCDFTSCGGKKAEGYGIVSQDGALPSRVRVYGNRFYSNACAGVWFDACDVLEITDNVFVENATYGVFACGKNVNNVTVMNNIFNKMLKAASGADGMCCVRVGAPGSDGNTITNFIVTGNNMTDFNRAESGTYPIRADLGKKSTLIVTDNICEANNVSAGIFVTSPDEACEADISVANNMFKLLAASGCPIEITAGKKISVSQNQFIVGSAKGAYGVSVGSKSAQSVFVSANIITISDGSGELADTSAVPDSACVTEFNIFNGKAYK